MKRLVIILGCLLLCCGCFNNEKNNIQDEYYKYLEMIENITSYTKEKAPCTIEVVKEESNYEKNHYTITISEPTIKMTNLKIIALPLEYENDEIVPNFNILEEVDVTSFNKKQTAIKLNYFSKHTYTKFKVMLSYDDSKEPLAYLKNVKIVK